MLERDPSQTQDPGATPGDAEDPTALIGSRPAQNARQVASTSEVDTEWRGADEAADFLGLDQELRGLDLPPAMPAMPSAPQAQPAEAQTRVESSEGQPMSPESVSSLLATMEGEPAADPGENPLAPGVATPDPFAFEESAPADEQPKQRGGRKALRAVAALVIVGLGVATYLKYFQHEPEIPLPPPTAKAPVRHTTPTTQPSGGETGTDLLASSSSHDLDEVGSQSDRPEDVQLSATTPGGSESADRIARGETLDPAIMPSPEFEQWMRDNNRSTWHGRDALTELSEQSSGSSPFDPLHQMQSIPAMRDAIAAADRASTTPGESSDSTLADSSTEPSGVRLNENAPEDAPPRETHSRLRKATADDLAGIWEGSTIPIESIDSTTRMLTPAVGRVRTILHGGEIFEGRLYAVGLGKVWLDTDLGRLALVSDQVKKLEQLASPDGTPVLGSAGSETLAGLPRVRARTPGGMFYGKVTSRDGNSVTLITDEGARITLDAPLIEPVPASKTVIVGLAPLAFPPSAATTGDKPAEAAAPKPASKSASKTPPKRAPKPAPRPPPKPAPKPPTKT